MKPKEGAPDFGWFAPFERLHLHVAGAEHEQEIEALTVDTAAVAATVAERRSFRRTLPDGWMDGGAVAETPLLWPPVLPPGAHTLTLCARDYAETSVTAIVTASAVTDVHVTLPRR